MGKVEKVLNNAPYAQMPPGWQFLTGGTISHRLSKNDSLVIGYSFEEPRIG
jgi:hypothetical protein